MAAGPDMSRRSVLVTGGSRRIGAAIVRVLAACGHKVAMHHHRADDPDAGALADELNRAGGHVVTVAGDLAEPGGPGAIFASARRALGGAVDGLVNCASVFEFDRPPAIDAALLARLMTVNLSAPVELAGLLARQDGIEDGAVVNILDQKIANLNPDFFSYTCTKLALEGATTMLAQALAPRVRVNAVSPGLSLPSHDQTEAEFAAVAGANLLQRQVSVAEIGRTVEFLLTNTSITGQNVFVDNGQRFLSSQEDVMFSTRTKREH